MYDNKFRHLAGYISRWYADGQFLVFFDEGDEAEWLDVDMSLIGKFATNVRMGIAYVCSYYYLRSKPNCLPLV